MNKKIKILIVDDSIFFRKILADKLSLCSRFEIIGYAVDAFDAEKKIPLLKPDVVTLDIEMPGLNGIQFLKQFLPIHLVPVVLVSSLNLNVFAALSSGAVDFVRKPDLTQSNTLSSFMAELESKIIIASNARIQIASPQPTTQKNISASSNVVRSTLSHGYSLIAIGASTGGTEATLTVLKDLPITVPPILVVQHMPSGFTKMYADRLNKLCKISVKEAADGDILQSGFAYIAAGDFHLRVVKKLGRYVLQCSQEDKVSGHRPSVDVLFDSVAKVTQKDAIGVIMTGMGQDGANGLLKLRQNGAFTIGQDEASCVVYGMPMVAKKIGAVSIEVPCNMIDATIQKQLYK